MFGVLFGHVWDMSVVFVGDVSGMFWSCSEYVVDMFGTCFGHVLDMFWTSFGHVVDKVWAKLGTSFGQCLGHIPDMFFAKVLLNYFHQPSRALPKAASMASGEAVPTICRTSAS